jgi:hypothetical protein
MKLFILLSLICTINAFTLYHEVHHEVHHNRDMMMLNYHTDQDILDMANEAMITVKKIILESCIWHGNMQYEITLMTHNKFLGLVWSTGILRNGVLDPSMLDDTDVIDMKIKLRRNIKWTSETVTDNSTEGINMVSVLLHETLHAMGITTTFSGKERYTKCKDGECYFSHFDSLMDLKQGRLIDHANETWLGEEIYIDDIRIYNPTFFQTSSSLSHLHDTESIMYYQLQENTIRKIDNKVLHILNRIGWNCTLSQEDVYTKFDIKMIEIIIGVVMVLIIFIMVACCLILQLYPKTWNESDECCPV